MKTFNQMKANKEIKRADGRQMLLQDLHEEPGFNLREDSEELAQSIDDLANYIVAGGIYPALEVRPRDAGGAWLVDGHRRYKALRKALAMGAAIADKNGQVWVDIVPFSGNDADRTLRVMTSNENFKLSPLEVSKGLKRLRAFGWSVTDIAQRMGKSRAHIEQLLLLADANSDVQQMVAAGTVSATVAIDTVRAHGEQAGAVIAKAAAENGGKKVTAKSMSIDRKKEAGLAVWESMSPNARKAEIGVVTVDASLLRALLKAVKVEV